MTYRGRGTPLGSRAVKNRWGTVDPDKGLYQTTAHYYGAFLVLGIDEYKYIRDKGVERVEAIPRSENGRIEHYYLADFRPIPTKNGPRYGAAVPPRS